MFQRFIESLAQHFGLVFILTEHNHLKQIAQEICLFCVCMCVCVCAYVCVGACTCTEEFMSICRCICTGQRTISDVIPQVLYFCYCQDIGLKLRVGQPVSPRRHLYFCLPGADITNPDILCSLKYDFHTEMFNKYLLIK